MTIVQPWITTERIWQSAAGRERPIERRAGGRITLLVWLDWLDGVCCSRFPEAHAGRRTLQTCLQGLVEPGRGLEPTQVLGQLNAQQLAASETSEAMGALHGA
jgi:hypothetical protein